MVHDRCYVFDRSETLLDFDEELDLCLNVFGYIDIYV
jgi:hypothetical protein